MSESKTPNVPLPWTLGIRKDGSQYINCGDPRTEPHCAFDITDWREVGQLAAAAPDLYSALEECAEDLAAEIEARYPAEVRHQYPQEARRYARDMEPVRQARAALSRARGEGA